MTQVNDQVRLRLILQLISDILRVFQKLLKFFNRKVISTLFVSPSAGVFPAILILDLDDLRTC